MKIPKSNKCEVGGMKHFVEFVGGIFIGIAWLEGIVLAHGFLSTAVAVCFPPYAWYLVVERLMIMVGLI